MKSAELLRSKVQVLIPIALISKVSLGWILHLESWFLVVPTGEKAGLTITPCTITSRRRFNNAAVLTPPCHASSIRFHSWCKLKNLLQFHNAVSLVDLARLADIAQLDIRLSWLQLGTHRLYQQVSSLAELLSPFHYGPPSMPWRAC